MDMHPDERPKPPVRAGNPIAGVDGICIEILWLEMTVIRVKLVGARGFEPPTTGTPCRCATRLRYAPMMPCLGRRRILSDGVFKEQLADNACE